MAVRKRTDYDGWIVDVVINGERVRETYPTKREAMAREKELHTQEATNTFKPPDRSVTFSDFIPIYLEWAQRNKAAKTAHDEGCVIRAQLLPFFGAKPLVGIDSQSIERFKAKRLHDGMKPRTVNIEVTLISVIFKLAIRWGYVRENPVKRVERLKIARRPPRYLSTIEIERLLASARQFEHLYPMLVTALHTGMRKQELFNLKWEDVAFDNNTVTVQPKDDWHTKKYGYRVLDMTAFLRQTLETLYGLRQSDQEYVFTYDGQKLSSNVTRSLNRVIRESGLKDVTLHTFRHSFASHLAMQGVPLMHIQQLLGHKDYNTTLIYAHLSTESVRSQVHRLPFNRNEDA